VILPLNQKVTPSIHYGLWVGFNDLNPFQPNSNVVLCTGSANWAKPPRLGEVADLVAFDALNQTGSVVGHTMAVNYPVGARPQCVDRHGQPFYLVNNIANGLPCIDIYDSVFARISRLDGFHHWCTTSDMSYSYCLDFHQTQILGGYGYIFSPTRDSSNLYEYPKSVSAFCHRSGSHCEVLSLDLAAEAVSRYLNVPLSSIKANSYLTHLLLSPCETKLACLFRCWLRDGGLLTALLIVDLTKDNGEVHVELVGQLSHYTWLSQSELVIYAYQIITPKSFRIRLNSYSLLIPFSKAAKNAINLLKYLQAFMYSIKPSTISNDSGVNFQFQKRRTLPCFVHLKNGHSEPLDLALPISDGHPSVKMAFGAKLMVSDTYPNTKSERCLFVVNLATSAMAFHTILAEYRPSCLPVYNWVNRYSSLPYYADFSISNQSFTRSGLHCDAHPFFDAVASQIGYHTSRNGYRTIEVVSL
jgi:hypothetical protein